jgi:hypothetical protein
VSTVSESRKPLDQWLPPEGVGNPLACIATSFTFEVDFFEQQCLARFLGLDWKRGEGDDLAFMIEQEEKLAETRVTVLVDRTSANEGRSLRWDLLPVAVRGGVMHAKVCLLVWERLVRAIVGSANLTSAGYRQQLEAQMVLDASAESELPTRVMIELIEAVRALARRAPGDADQPGPKHRAFSTLDDAARRLTAFGERRERRGGPRLRVIAGAPGNPVLDAFDAIWQGGPPRSATVLSPFFDAVDQSLTVEELARRLAARGRAEVSFVVASEQLESRQRIQAPSSLIRSLPNRTEGCLRSLRFSKDEEPRVLHAKVLTLANEHQVAVLIGSSNFTEAGLAIGGKANLEINIALGAHRDSAASEALLRLIPAGDQLLLKEVDWTPEPPEEEQHEPMLPWGFSQALIEPLPDPALILRLDSELPPRWWVRDHAGKLLADSERWAAAGRPRPLRVALSDDVLPYFLRVDWVAPEGRLSATWPVNVTDTAALPPPEELRHLPVDALIAALASSRPLHESLSRELKSTNRSGVVDDLNPLQRFSETGQLLRRTKRVSLALAGLRERLERPAASEEALTWRLTGPFGPAAIAEGLLEQARQPRAVCGEASFLLAELALTLTRVDWERTGRLLNGGTRVARKHARSALAAVRELRDQADEDPRLAAYVDRAFTRAKL